MWVFIAVGFAALVAYTVVLMVKSFFSWGWISLVLLAILFLMACYAVKVW